MKADWDEAVRTGRYAISTRGMTLDDVGFIHASCAHQVDGVASRYYAEVVDPMVLLVLDTEPLGSVVRFEVGGPGDEQFPHIYGPISPDDVIEVLPVAVRSGGGALIPPL